LKLTNDPNTIDKHKMISRIATRIKNKFSNSFKDYTNEEIKHGFPYLEKTITQQNSPHIIKFTTPQHGKILLLGEYHMKKQDEYDWCQKHINTSTTMLYEQIGISGPLTHLLLLYLSPMSLYAKFKFGFKSNISDALIYGNLQTHNLESSTKWNHFLYEKSYLGMISYAMFTHLPDTMLECGLIYLSGYVMIGCIWTIQGKLYSNIQKYEDRFNLDRKIQLDAIVYGRDKDMADEIKHYIDKAKPDETPICIVGCGHTIGISYQLINKGYKFESIEFYK